MTALLDFIIPNELQYACHRLLVYTSVQMLVYSIILVAASFYLFHFYWYTYYATQFDSAPFGWRWIASSRWTAPEQGQRSDASKRLLNRGRRFFGILLQGLSVLVVASAVAGPVLLENETCLHWTRF